MALIDEIAQYLADNSIGTVGTDIFKSSTPDQPDNCITVLDTGGQSPSKYIPTGRPTAQIFVRNKSYSAGEAKMKVIVDLLHNQYNVELISGGIYFFSINLVSEAGHIGRDSKERELFSANFILYRRGR